jgi:hypothetical protein
LITFGILLQQTLLWKNPNFFVLITNLTHFFSVFISFLYMFRSI